MRCELGKVLAAMEAGQGEIVDLVLDDRDSEPEFRLDAIESITGVRFLDRTLDRHRVRKCGCAPLPVEEAAA